MELRPVPARIGEESSRSDRHAAFERGRTPKAQEPGEEVTLETPRPIRAQDHYTELGDVVFHWRQIGDPDAPTLLMLHGIMGHSREWDGLYTRMLPDYRVIALDQRGHGTSGWAPPYTAALMAEDAVALIRHIGLGSVILVGHSMGGMAAMLAAAQHPSLIDRLVIIDIGPDALSTDFISEAPAWMHQMAAATYGSVDEAVAEWQAGNPLAREDLLRHYVGHCLVPAPDGGLKWCFDAGRLGSFFTEGSNETELWDAIDHITCPTLVIRGEHSYMLSEETQRAMANRLADASTTVITGGGHDLGVEQPEAIATEIGRFLDGGRRTWLDH